MKNRVMTGMALVLGVLALGLNGRAQAVEGWGPTLGGEGEHEMGPRLLAMLENDQFKAALGLTDEQTERLHRIVVETEKSTTKTRAEMAIRRIELRELLRGDKPDQAAVTKKIQEISDLLRDTMKQHVDALLAAKAVLTPEQQKKIRSFIESRRGGEFWQRRGLEGHGGRPPEPPRSPAEPRF